MENENGMSRYVNSVINHFAGGKDGHSRLLNEIEDFIHCIEKDVIIYASPSGIQLGFKQEAIVGKLISEILHPNDYYIYEKYRNKSRDFKPFCAYIRYSTSMGPELYEVRGKLYKFIGPAPSAQSHSLTRREILVLSARKYASKSMQALDDVVELRIENLSAWSELEGLKGGLQPQPLQVPEQANLFIDNFIDGLGLMNPMDTYPLLQDPNSNSSFSTQPQPPLRNLKAPYSMFNMQSELQPYTGTQNIIPTFQSSKSKSTGQSLMPGEQQKKKRKKKPAGNMFCLQCGTNQSPEWRSGPEGPKTYKY